MGKLENAERGSYIMPAVLGKDYLWSKPELSHKYYGIHNFLILMIRLTGFKFRWVSVCSYTYINSLASWLGYIHSKCTLSREFKYLMTIETDLW